MNFSETTDYKKFLFVSSGLVALLILCGMVAAIRTSGTLFSGGALAIRNASFDETAFFDTFSKSITTHLVYCIGVLVFAGGFPGILFTGGYLAFKAFSLGATVGLAARCCIFSKAAAICLGVFVSNFLVFPLYFLMFLISLAHCSRVTMTGTGFGEAFRDYFSFAARIVAVFAVICAVEFIQSGISVFLISRLC